MRRLGAAVVGLGVGEQHARAYLRTGQCSLRWVYDLEPARSHRIVAALGQGQIAEDYEAILADESVELVSIASFDDVHAAQTIAALRAGKHVFVEKPLCRSIEELRAVQQAWRSSEGLQLASNLVLRTAPLYVWLKRAVQSGELGRIYAFDGDYLYGRMEKITQGWRKDVEGYSVMQGGGVHLVDLMCWITGQRPAKVTAIGNRICTEGTAFRCPDFAAGTYQFDSGLVGRITANFGCVHPHQHVLRVFGTKGTFLYDDRGPRFQASRDPSAPAKPLDLSPLPATKGDLIPAFVQAILRGEDTRSQTELEFDTLNACLAADASLATGATVKVEYP